MPKEQSYYFNQKSKFDDFVSTHIKPHASQLDVSQIIPPDLFSLLAKEGYLGASIPQEYGGQSMDYLSLGLMHEAFGKSFGSLENVLTVYGMVCKPLISYGSDTQKEAWLPKIASGKVIVALAITEPNAGSDLKSIETTIITQGDNFLLNGKKKYITLGQIADLFLVLAMQDDRYCALLVDRNTPGLSVQPLTDIMGLRANMLGEISFVDCLVPQSNLLGKNGNALTRVIASALDEGRYTTAWGSLGLGQGCLDAVTDHIHSRVQGGTLIRDYQLIQKMHTEIIVNVKAARGLCIHAANTRINSDPAYLSETLIAKYFASRMAVLASNHALQIYGASGVTAESSVGRFYRDAKMMEIIEGTSQIYETNISQLFYC